MLGKDQYKDYYLAIKRHKVLIKATIWITFKNITFKEAIQIV